MTADGAEQGATTRRDLADEYLNQAVEALRQAGSPESLYGHTARESDNPMIHGAAHALARGKRVGFSRNAILFAALASEGYINAFLAEHLSGADLDALDRLSTTEKYVI